MNNYLKYRGKCKEMAEALAKENPDLKLVRGYYYEPLWSSDDPRGQPHWWCVDKDGKIHDPTKLQFPSGGIEEWYTAYNSLVYCSECGDELPEESAIFEGNYCFCSNKCYMKFVGI